MFGNLRNGFKSLPWPSSDSSSGSRLTGSNKNNSSNQILIGSIRPGGQLSCYYFLSKWPNNLNRCLHRLHPTSSYNIQILMHISVNKANILHQLGPLKLYKWHHIDCSFVFFVLSCVGTIVRDHASRPLEQLLAIFDVGHWVQSVILDWEFIIQ